MNFSKAACLLAVPVLFLTGCGSQYESVYAAPGDAVHTALFDFTISDVTVVDSYSTLTPSDGHTLVQMDLTVTNTGEETLTMFAQDFQLQWGDGDEEFGTCLVAVDTSMVPDSYTVEPGTTHEGLMVVEVPEGTSTITVAYQEQLANGDAGTAYFVEADL